MNGARVASSTTSFVPNSLYGLRLGGGDGDDQGDFSDLVLDAEAARAYLSARPEVAGAKVDGFAGLEVRRQRAERRGKPVEIVDVGFLVDECCLDAPCAADREGKAVA